MSEYLPKIQKYCDYQERYQQEVRDKLYAWDVKPDEVENLIAYLVEHDYINEERYARAFARGKFRIKHWGRHKIRLALKQRKISDYCIKEGLKDIEERDYLETLKLVLDKRKKDLKAEQESPLKQRKIAHYVISKGFESDLVWDLLNKK